MVDRPLDVRLDRLARLRRDLLRHGLENRDVAIERDLEPLCRCSVAQGIDERLVGNLLVGGEGCRHGLPVAACCCCSNLCKAVVHALDLRIRSIAGVARQGQCLEPDPGRVQESTGLRGSHGTAGHAGRQARGQQEPDAASRDGPAPHRVSFDRGDSRERLGLGGDREPSLTHDARTHPSRRLCGRTQARPGERLEPALDLQFRCH